MKALLALLPLAACSPAVFGQTDGFPAELSRGCSTTTECSALWYKAHQREADCLPNTIGYIRCDDAERDAMKAWHMLQDRKQADYSRKLAEQQDSYRRREDERRAREEATATEERAAAQAERERVLAEKLAAEEAAAKAAAVQEDADLERYKAMDARGRAAELRRCHAELEDCERLMRLLRLCTDDREQAQLAQLHRTLTLGSSQQRPSAERWLVCRDGSSSGCPCGGSHRGCCSHHGGVSGCQ